MLAWSSFVDPTVGFAAGAEPDDMLASWSEARDRDCFGRIYRSRDGVPAFAAVALNGTPPDWTTGNQDFIIVVCHWRFPKSHEHEEHDVATKEGAIAIGRSVPFAIGCVVKYSFHTTGAVLCFRP